ncbi:MAG: hypothetical protein DMF52_14710 [Acidobacteria bacterium]|nr:MAG: hypothetical protein DMF52_14710 [Acidobacteriota bacterium]
MGLHHENSLAPWLAGGGHPRDCHHFRCGIDRGCSCDTLHLSRNHFDRVGHLAQGFIPAMFVREFLRRAGGLRPGALLGFLCVSVCLAFSAFYEILEWRVVLTFYPTSGPEWLGMQGDPWDTQEDMLMALIGSSASVLTLSSLHERSMAALSDPLAGATPRARA